MKSYNCLQDSLNNQKSDTFIFKQSILNKSYSLSTLKDIKKFQSKHKCNLYEYVDYNKNIRLFFYIELNNTKQDFDAILTYIIHKLNIKIDDLIIIQETDLLFRIIHKYFYIENIKLLDQYLYNFNIFNVKVEKNDFIPTILNDNIIIHEKYEFSETILNNVYGLDKLDVNIDLINIYKNSRYLEPINFNDSDTLFIKSDMGTGKSTATVNYIKDNNIESFLILSCRRTLTYTIYDKLKSSNIEVDNYISINSNKVILSNKLIISPDSLYKIKYPLKKFDFIWIDEGVSFMYYLGNHLFIESKFKKEIMIIIDWLLKNCKKLLITDADLNHNIIKFYLYFRNISYTNYFIYKKQKNPNKYSIIDNEEDILNKLKTNIENNHNLYICCDTLSKTKFIYDFIIKLNLISDNKVLLYNSESNHIYDKQMYDVNNFWCKYQIVIVSPKVVFGVDFNLQHFDYVYGFYKCTTLTVRECYQQLHRIRNVKQQEFLIHIYETKQYNFVNSLTNLKYHIETNNLENVFYKKTYLNIDFISNTFIFNITKNGYKYLDMNEYINYLILYCIYETNLSLNNFKAIFNNKIYDFS